MYTCHFLKVLPQELQVVMQYPYPFSQKMKLCMEKTPEVFSAGVTNLYETESYFLVQIHAKGYQFDTHTSEIKFVKFVFNYVTFN